jgi:hypothetical protein
MSGCDVDAGWVELLGPVLAKPFRPDDLIDRVGQMLVREASRRA